MRNTSVSRTRLLLMDVDGVLTSGEIIYASNQTELKVFNVQDGMGITLAKAAGLKVGVLTGRTCDAVKRRCAELGFDILLQNCPNKREGYDAIRKKYGYADDEVAYIGDDIQDLPILERVGVPLGVSNSIKEVKRLCMYVASRPGGNGAVREIVDWMLERRNRKQDAIRKVIRHTKNAVVPQV